MSYTTSNFNQFFSKLFGKNHFNELNSENNVFQKRYSNFKNFVFHWKDSLNKSAIPTQTEITFSNYFGFGSHLDFVKRLIGKPVTAFENKDYDTVILMYLIEIRGFKVNFELHFYENKLFCINYQYIDISEEERRNTIQTLLDKFNISGAANFNSSIIVDNYGNGLFIEDGKYFSVNYISPNSNVQQLINAYMITNKEVI
jgi:hypothetical protein